MRVNIEGLEQFIEISKRIQQQVAELEESLERIQKIKLTINVKREYK